VVLVGGQSLTAWVEYYKIPLPPFEDPYLTADADFRGTKREAEAIARFLGGKFEAPEMGDSTPNAAIVVFTGERGEKLNIDILTGVLGVPDAAVKKLAIPLAIDGCEPIQVLHPLLVLESRCANLLTLRHKRESNGITQARVACEVVARYLDECLADPKRKREALKATKRIAALAKKEAGTFVWKEWGIDVMSAVDQSKMPQPFGRSWAYDKKEVARKREIATRPPKPKSKRKSPTP